jgi:hypothetical protein
MAEKCPVKICLISGSFRKLHRLGMFDVVSESLPSAPAATRFLQLKSMWFLFNSAQRDHKNTDVYLAGFRIDIELSLYPCIYRSYYIATGKQASVSSTFFCRLQTFMDFVIDNKHTVDIEQALEKCFELG